jgi:two-component system chemotaxis response regulator CheB
MDRQAVPVNAVSVVGIGASAGGIGAIPVVLAALSFPFGAAVVIVQHLDPHRRSHFADILGRRCALSVREAVHGEIVRCGVVYVAPPDAHVLIRGDTVALSDAAPVHFSRPSIDVLFDSMATSCGDRAIGVVLTGSGRDGAEGLRAIKRLGGRTIVQDPAEAEHRGMPSAAYATGCADLSLPLREIGPALVACTTLTGAIGE